MRLRPLAPADYGWLFALSTLPEVAGRWRHRPGTLSPEAFPASVWQTVLCQFAIERLSDQQPLGLVVAYQADLVNGIGYLAILTNPNSAVKSGPEAAGIFIDYLFQNYPLRKLYGESSSHTAVAFQSAFRGLLHEEGRLRDHVLIDGNYVDWITSALYRSDWFEMKSKEKQRAVAAQSVQES